MQYVESLEPQVGNVHKHTQGLVRRSRDLANGLFEFGLAFTLLGQSEQGVLEYALTEVGHTADKLSVLAAEQAEKEARKAAALAKLAAKRQPKAVAPAVKRRPKAEAPAASAGADGAGGGDDGASARPRVDRRGERRGELDDELEMEQAMYAAADELELSRSARGATLAVRLTPRTGGDRAQRFASARLRMALGPDYPARCPGVRHSSLTN